MNLLIYIFHPTQFSNIGKEFLKLLDKSFPPYNPLCKNFNRQTVKLGYKCMPNMASAVAMHNKKLLQEDQQDADLPGCNCQVGPAVCPVQGRCLTKSVIYRATVTETASGQVETYTGVTGNTFKSRYNGHNSDMNNEENRHKTTLGNHIWNLKEENKPFSVEWKLVDRGSRFNPTNKKCRICLKEKKEILYNRLGSTLNKRNKVSNTCRHRLRNLLSNWKT